MGGPRVEPVREAAQQAKNLDLAVSDVMNGYSSASQAASMYEVRARTIRSRVDYATKSGGTGSPLPRGRRQIFSPEVITQEKEKTRALDDKLRSLGDAATRYIYWACGQIKGYYQGCRGVADDLRRR